MRGDPTAAQRARRQQEEFPQRPVLDAKRNLLYSLDIDAGNADRHRSGRQGSPSERCTWAAGRTTWSMARNGSRLYVSDWAGRTRAGRRSGRFARGGEDRRRRASQSDRPASQRTIGCSWPAPAAINVAVIDTQRGVVTETIFTALFPKSPEGSTPDALAVSPDGETLFVANADNNCIAVIDIESPSRSQVQGFIPTGWYPTAVAVTPDGKQSAGRRGQGKPDQGRIRSPAGRRRQSQRRRAIAAARIPYIGTTLSGALSIVPIPDDEQVGRVYRDGLSQLSLLRQAADRRAVRREDGHPDQGGRALADQARDLHHQGEPHLRSGVRRHRPRQRRPVAGDVRRGGDAQPSQAGQRVRAARQLVLQRPRLGRRPSLVDDGLQHRLHRPQLGADLFEPRGDRGR